MFCSKCGKESLSSESFCSSCGNNLNSNSNNSVSSGYYSKSQYVDNAPGKGLIMVTSILYIILGAIMTIIGFIGLSNWSDDVARQMQRALGVEAEIIYVMLLLQTANYIMAIIAGVLGVRNTENLEKASFLFTFGIVMAAVQGCNFVGQLSTISFSIIDTLTLVLPVLFIMGAYRNKQAYILNPKRTYTAYKTHLTDMASSSFQGSKKCEKCSSFYESNLNSCPECGFRPNIKLGV